MRMNFLSLSVAICGINVMFGYQFDRSKIIPHLWTFTNRRNFRQMTDIISNSLTVSTLFSLEVD